MRKIELIDKAIDRLTCISEKQTDATTVVWLHGSLNRIDTTFFEMTFKQAGETVTLRFPHSTTCYERDGDDTALIKITAGLAIALGVERFILTESELERKREAIARFNVPLIVSRVEKKPEKVGNVRI